MNEIIGMIVDTAATVVAAAFLLRFWAQVARVRPPESFARFIFKASNWLVLPLRRILPNGRYDWACLIGTLLVAVISVLPALWLSDHFNPKFILLISIQQLMNWIFYGFMGLMVMEALLSWVNPHAPIAPFISGLTAPLLRPIRQLVPPLGGLDLSMLIGIVGLRVILMLINSTLVSFI
ncbi:MAG: YggT family protein [Oxalobacter sp.]|nr:MAG: YggT family protein [Oxalobacter sp.]